MNLILVAGARPNFMKIAPIIRAINKFNTESFEKKIFYKLVHTGQHFDHNMSDTFFKQLQIPEPDINLNCGGGSQAEQTAAIMVAFEKYLLNNQTDLVVVVGDVTSTLACSIVAKKLNTKVAHVEAGIRSGDMTMPEEINRIVTDSLSDYFFTTTTWASDNLRKSGIDDSRIFLVGNVMIDTLLHHLPEIKKPVFWESVLLENNRYLVLTLHRPANVDDESKLFQYLHIIGSQCEAFKIVFPVHPRTRKSIETLTQRGLKVPENIILIEPLGYLEFMYLVKNSFAVITDSGGITEETTVLGIPCITLRDTTERPETVEIGTNVLAGTNPDNLVKILKVLLNGKWKKGRVPDFWDGNSSNRIVHHLSTLFK